MSYKEFKKLDLPAIDKEMLAFWKEQDVFNQSVNNRNAERPFIFYEGPPSANGMPGIHHVMSRTIKDMFCRYKTLQGYRVERKGGWDTHGLPVELGVEKKLGITKEDIGTKISVADYNKQCRSEVLKYKDAWDDLTTKMGFWVDLKDPYITFENDYIETLWWLLRQLYEKRLLYKGLTIQPYSPAAGTGLSSHELNYAGAYRMVKDTSATAQFKVIRDSKSAFLFKDKNEVFFLAWTTTPWTLPSNTALAVGETLTYVLVKTFNPYTSLPVNVILAKELVSKYFNTELSSKPLEEYREGDKEIPYKVIAEFKGKDLDGVRYEQLMPYVQPADGDAFKVILGDFVSTEEGTGIVHIAPSFGADDMRMSKKYGLGTLTLVDKKGRFVQEVTDFAGVPVKNYEDDPNYESVDIQIAVKLKKENKAFKVEKYEHNYPHCWRTDKPVIYYPLDSWFIKTTAVKNRLIELNKTINWKPPFTGTGRFGNWLENLVDWNLSRSRFWGTPLPIWRGKTIGPEEFELCVGSKHDLISCTDNQGNKCIGFKIKHSYFPIINGFLDNKDEGEKLYSDLRNYYATNNEGDVDVQLNYFRNNFSGLNNIYKKRDLLQVLPQTIFEAYTERTTLESINSIDFHKPYIDEVFFQTSTSHRIGSGKKTRMVYCREPDLIDVWFDSGAMPYAQWHYPFEAKAKIDEGKAFPADFISEGVDQTRGWFFTLHAIAVLLFDSVAYKNVLSHGLLLDKDGNKMSKRLGNTVNPFETIEKFGADATRWYMISNSDPWDNLKFDPNGITETQRKFFGTLFNTYSFFALYANIDGFKINELNIVPHAKRSELDQWIISKLHSLAKLVTERLDDYDPTPAARAIEEFVNDHLSNWYVRLSRRRFWKGEMNEDKKAAYETLFECLMVTAQLMSPIAPFFSDWLYNNLTSSIREAAVKNKTPLRFASIHLTDLTRPEEKLINRTLEEQMDYAQRISSLVLSLRKKVNIKVRQPLNKILLPVLNENFEKQVEHVRKLILSEVNVKELEYIYDTAGVIKKKAKPDFKKLGAKLGPRMKEVAGQINNFTQEQIAQLEKSGSLELSAGKEKFILKADEVEIISEDIPGWLVAHKDDITVALDINLTDKLKDEGNAREFVNKIQNLRKEKTFNVTDRIVLEVERHQEINSALINFKQYICSEVLAEELSVVDSIAEGNSIEINDIPVKVNVFKKS